MESVCAEHLDREAFIYCMDHEFFYCDDQCFSIHSKHNAIPITKVQLAIAAIQKYYHFKNAVASLVEARKQICIMLNKAINHSKKQMATTFKHYDPQLIKQLMENQIVKPVVKNTFEKGTMECVQAVHQLCAYIESFKEEISNIDDRICIANSKNAIHTWKDNTIVIFNSMNNAKSTYKIPKSIAQGGSNSISVGNNIYLFVGYTNEFYKFKLLSIKFKSKAPLLCAKGYEGLCQNQKSIFSIGGWTGIALHDCERFNISENKWYQLPKLLKPNHNCAAFIIKDVIYTFGGQSTERVWYNSMEKYIINGVKWEQVELINPPLPRRCIHGTVIRDDKVIIMGGDVAGMTYM